MNRIRMYRDGDYNWYWWQPPYVQGHSIAGDPNEFLAQLQQQGWLLVKSDPGHALLEKGA